jgi:hypothetical protein
VARKVDAHWIGAGLKASWHTEAAGPAGVDPAGAGVPVVQVFTVGLTYEAVTDRSSHAEGVWGTAFSPQAPKPSSKPTVELRRVTRIAT